MPMSSFGRSRWFGDDEEQDGPTPLFPSGVVGTDKQSMFPVKSDESPVLSGLKAGWKGLGDWLQAPADSQAGAGGELLGYKPTSHLSAIGSALTGAAKGVMGARGPYANWLGSGAVGATEGLEASRKQDLELRKLAQEQQYKQAEVALKAVQARNEAAKALHAGEYTIGRTRFDETGKPIVTAPPEEMSEADKARIANEDRRIDLEGRRADQTEAYQRAQLAQGAAGQAETAGYHKTEAGLARQRLEVERQNAGTPKSEPERDRAKLLELSDKVRNNTASPAEIALYERMHREAGQEKVTVDPSGMVTKVAPDITDLPPPPSQAGQPPPVPGVSQAPGTFPRAQLEDSQKKYTAYKTVSAAAADLEAEMKDITPGELISSDKATRINLKAGTLVNGLAQYGGTGVVQQGEAERYQKQIGDLTGMYAAGKKFLGIDRTKAALDEIRNLGRQSVKGAAPPVGSMAEARALPKGQPFVLPNGRLAVAKPDGSGVDYLDGGP